MQDGQDNKLKQLCAQASVETDVMELNRLLAEINYILLDSIREVQNLTLKLARNDWLM